MKTVISRKLTHAKKEDNGPSTEGCRPEHVRRTVRGTSQDSAGEGGAECRGSGGTDRGYFKYSIPLGKSAFISQVWTTSANCRSLEIKECSESFSGKIKNYKKFVKTLLTESQVSCIISFATLELANISYRRSRFPVVSSVATCGRSRLFFIYTT